MPRKTPAIKYREVAEDPAFAASLRKIVPDARRADEFIDGTKWTLARDPTFGKPTGPAGLVWTIDTDPSAGTPQLTVYYSWDDETVSLHDIEIKPDDP